MTADTGPRLHIPPTYPKDLGAVRTIMGADRTLMAWIRTALSMYSFGFTIYKFLETAAKAGDLDRPESPQRVGLFLVGIGTLSMVMGLVSYWATLREISRAEKFRIWRPVLFISTIMTIAGAVLFCAIATRIV